MEYFTRLTSIFFEATSLRLTFSATLRYNHNQRQMQNDKNTVVTPSGSIFFRMEGMFLGKSISPSNIPLSLLSEFVNHVSAFLRGTKRVSLDQIKISVEKAP